MPKKELTEEITEDKREQLLNEAVKQIEKH